MITTYDNSDYRITYDGISMVENALENPGLVQVSVVSGCTVIINASLYRDYGDFYLPNREYKKWYLTGYNTRLNRDEAHFIYARLNRADTNAMVVFSVNDYLFDGKIADKEDSQESEDYYFLKIGSITATDEQHSLDREISLDGGCLDTDWYNNNNNDGGWRQLFRVTADNLIQALKHFTSFVVEGTLSVIGKIVLNNKQVSNIAREGDAEKLFTDDESVPTAAYLQGKYLAELRKYFLNKDREDKTDFLQRFLGGIVTDLIKSQNFISGMMGTGMCFKINEDGTSYAEVDRLLVRMKAYFQMLTIMQTEFGGREWVLNAGAQVKCTKVEYIGDVPAYFTEGTAAYFSDGKRAHYPGFYRCYFLSDDGETAVENTFKVGDMARAQDFNIKAGVYEGVSNRFFWRKVIGVGDDYIDLSAADCAEGSDIPKEGDTIVQMGNDRDPDRQNLIVLSAFGSGAPSITFYRGVDSYSLSGKEVFTVGWDGVNGEVRFDCYGRTYIGDRKRESYFEFVPGKGASLVIGGQDVGATLKAMPGGIMSQVNSVVGGLRSEIRQTTDSISLKVEGMGTDISGIKSGLSATGIDIGARTVTLTASQFLVKDNGGKGIAVFKLVNGKPVLKAENIDVDSLKVKHLDGADGSFKGSVSIAGGKILLNTDGSGKLANGNITWDSSGNLTMKYTFSITADGYTLKLDPEFSEFRIYDSSDRVVVALQPFVGDKNTSPALVLDYYGSGGSRKRGFFNASQLTVGDFTGGKSAVFGFDGITFVENSTRYEGYTGTSRVVISVANGEPTYMTLYFRNGIIYDIS